MLHIDKWKVILVIVISFLGVIYALPNVMPATTQVWMKENLPSWAPSHTVSLGLDLRGGSHLLLEVDAEAVIAERLDSMVEAARSELRKEDIGYVGLAPRRDGLSFTLRNPEQDRAAAMKIARGLEQQVEVTSNSEGEIVVTLGEAAMRDINTQVVNQSIEIVRRRIDESGTREPIIQRQGVNRIVVQLPGIGDPAHVKSLIGRTAKMTFHLLDADAMSGKVSPGARRLPMREDKTQSISVRRRAVLSGDMLIDSQPSFDQQNGAPVVSFRFNALGAKRFCEVTRENVGKPFAIVLDDEVISAPVIRDSICGGSGVISGSFTVKEANDLSLLLRAGALPAPLEVVEERSVGPTLGSDSIAAGKTAGIVALVMVFIFMALTYGLLGMFANIGLVFTMTFIFAIMSFMQVTLTLPGIAAIVLIIGIAVDANVLIYERIREELKAGRSLVSALDNGYRMAMATIVDSNLTTLIVALILFSFGSGPVKGFAVAMTIGVITSMFSAIMLTRLMVVSWLRRTRPTTLHL